MSAPESKGARPAWAGRRVLIAGAAAVALALGAVAAVSLDHSAAGHSSGGHRLAAPSGRTSLRAQLTSLSCSGPTGAAYVADAGWDGFTAINTANCGVLQTYNVGDPYVATTPATPGDQNYSATDEAVAISGDTLYFADAGDDNVGIIDTANLNTNYYNVSGEIDVHVGFVPTGLTVNPAGTQVWVADSGPQTGPQSPSGISILSTASNTVVASFHLPAGPEQVAFSPDGSTAYVTTSAGLYVISTATDQVTGLIGHLGDPHGVVVSPDGSTVYVTNTVQNVVDVISTATDQVTATIPVGQLPWDEVLSSDGKTLYVADPDSNQVSVIDTATNSVTGTLSVQGDPDTLALTADGSQLWVGTLTYCWVFVYSTATLDEVGGINLAGPGTDNLNYADGFEPTGIVLTTTSSPGSDSTAKVKLNVPAANLNTNKN
ncbi:MAG TPA: beta-propeller fold lactonase family protein [Streptosporangiaceae bacterium]|nr:beta-propeller fold lactonase family protein [Streptosporangiaceae bacterium]